MSQDKKEQKEKQPNDVAQLLAFAGDRRWLTYLGCVLSAISQLLGFVPFICIWLVARDLLAVAPNWQAAGDLSTYGWVALGFSVLAILVYFVGLMCTHLAAFRTASNMRKRTSERMTKVPLGYFDTHASGELRRVIDGCSASTEQLLAHILPDAAGSVAMVLGMFALFFVFDWRLGVACLVPVVISILCMMKMMSGRGMEFMQLYQEALVRMTKTGTEYVRGIPVVKVFQQTVYSFKAFHDAIDDYSKMAMDYAVKWCQPAQVTNLTALNGLVIFLVPTALFLAPGEVDFEHFLVNFASYAVFSALVPTAMTKVMFMGEATQVAGDAVQRVNSLLSAPMLSVSANPVSPDGNDVVFDDVTFTYEGAEQPALEHVSFTVPQGATVALVGPSGGGKSTAASLVPRFWDADSGAVRIGGADVREMDPHDVMERVAFVFQTNQLFRTTLLENVRAARPDATREEVFAALEAAQCTDIVEKLPKGVDTMLGVGGAYLSGGEVQRVALARAILKDAPIVVLDEATAFADPENEALIQRAFARLAQGRTVIMIAHRLSTVTGADSIVVLDHGHVAEQGKHDELVAAGGVYARMWTEYERAVTWRIVSQKSDAEHVDSECARSTCSQGRGVRGYVSPQQRVEVARTGSTEGGEA